jgi:hypothetical protein
MLSFLYRLIRAFDEEHGYRPNVVLMNRQHYRQLQENLPELQDYAPFLGLEIILSEECVHPHVAWLPQARHASTAG